MSYATYEWFLKKDLSEYAGKWIAIIDNKIVASGHEVAKVIAGARKAFPNKKPFITKVQNKLSVLMTR